MKDNEIEVLDIEDMSVGLRSMNILKVEINEEFLELMNENGTLKQFRKDLKELCSKYFEPEFVYVTYMKRDDVEENA